MKKFYFSILIVGLAYSSLHAQSIPNADFESWTSQGTYENPDGWGTLNNTTSGANVFTATKGSGTASGNYLKLTSSTYGEGVKNGIAVSGRLDSITMQPISGFAYSGRPESIKGKWQHMIFGNSQGSISVTFTKWNSETNKRDTLGSGRVQLTGMAMSWQDFNIPINFSSEATSDSCIIFLQASGAAPTNMDYLWVDDLSFTGDQAPTSIKNVDNSAVQLNIFPNPATSVINININAIKAQKSLNISLADLSGRIVYNKSLQGVQQGHSVLQINSSVLPAGTYILKVAAINTSISQKITIK